MKNMSPYDPLVDDIGALLEAAAADPARLEVLKAEARQQLTQRATRPDAQPEETVETDDEDLWNNVPI